MLPQTHTVTRSRWKDYNEVNTAFAKISPFHTRTNALRSMGFDPEVSPNVHMLTYVEIIQRFMPTPDITKADLPKPVRDCIAARDRSCAYEIDLSDTHDDRHGNVFLDMFGFKRHTTVSGWEFKGLILMTDGIVVYKLSAGDPMISKDTDRVHPLGPFQELDNVVVHAVPTP